MSFCVNVNIWGPKNWFYNAHAWVVCRTWWCLRRRGVKQYPPEPTEDVPGQARHKHQIHTMLMVSSLNGLFVCGMIRESAKRGKKLAAIGYHCNPSFRWYLFFFLLANMMVSHVNHSISILRCAINFYRGKLFADMQIFILDALTS